MHVYYNILSKNSFFSSFSAGVSPKIRGRLQSEDTYKPPTPPRSILTQKHKAVSSPSTLSVDSAVSDEVFVPTSGQCPTIKVMLKLCVHFV